jgi:uncharacterized protein YndB with AHSA1/START domain
MTDDPTGTESQITLTRTIDAPIEDVFAAWTDPALLEQWQADEAEVEPFAGGTYRFVSIGDDEDPGEHVVSGEYVEFVEDKRLAMSWVYRGEEGENDLIFYIEVEFAEGAGGSTTLTLTERGVSHADPESRIFSMEAWSAAIAHLAELIE